MIFIHAGTVSFEAAYLLSFLTSFSLRISIFGHMDDPAGGPVGRVFSELDLFQYRLSGIIILQGNVSPITRTVYLTSGFLNFWWSEYGSRTYRWLNFRRDGIWWMYGYRNTSDRILKWWRRFFPMPYRKNASGLFSIFHFPFFQNQKTWLHKKQSSF